MEIKTQYSILYLDLQENNIKQPSPMVVPVDPKLTKTRNPPEATAPNVQLEGGAPPAAPGWHGQSVTGPALELLSLKKQQNDDPNLEQLRFAIT